MGMIYRNGLPYGGTYVDPMLSTESENPVQNKVVTLALNDKANADDVQAALAGKMDLYNNYLEIGNQKRLYISDTTPTGDIPEGSFGIGF
jgi:hypothetical protein